MRGSVVTTHLASRISHPVAPTFRRRMDYSYRSATIGSRLAARRAGQMPKNSPTAALKTNASRIASGRSEEHTSELQSLAYLVCRLLLEKKKKHRDVRKHK